MRKFAYIYFMKNDPALIQSLVPKHVEYWHRENPPGYAGGPFADRSGGMILFDSDDQQQASLLAGKDPFRTDGAIEKYEVKEWLVK